MRWQRPYNAQTALPKTPCQAGRASNVSGQQTNARRRALPAVITVQAAMVATPAAAPAPRPNLNTRSTASTSSVFPPRARPACTSTCRGVSRTAICRPCASMIALTSSVWRTTPLGRTTRRLAPRCVITERARARCYCIPCVFSRGYDVCVCMYVCMYVCVVYVYVHACVV